MITVWGRVSSSNVQAALWCLAELELAFERIDAGFIYGVTDTPAYLEMNPNRFVPTIVDGGNPPLFETGAIIRATPMGAGAQHIGITDGKGRAVWLVPTQLGQTTGRHLDHGFQLALVAPNATAMRALIDNRRVMLGFCKFGPVYRA